MTGPSAGGALTLLVNPAAGSGAATAVARLAGAVARDAGYAVRVVAGRDRAEAADLLTAALRSDTRGVVAVGGDGTAQTAAGVLAGTGVPLGLVPVGSGNDLVRALALPAAPMAATARVLDALATARTQPLDVGTVTTVDGTTSVWLTVLCVGFDARVSERAARSRVPGPRRYDVATAREAARLRPTPLRLTLDDSAAEDLDVTLVAVGNTSTYGGGLRICPDADSADGRLEVTVAGPMHAGRLLRLAPRLRTGDLHGVPEVRRHRVTRLRVEGPDVRCWADGEPMAALPVDVTVRPAALHLLT